MKYKLGVLVIFIGTIFIIGLGYQQRMKSEQAQDSSQGSEAKFGREPEASTANFSRSIKDIEQIQPTSTVELSDGDTYKMQIKPVQGQIAGKEVRLLSYNGSVPGPIIKVRQGATIKLQVENLAEIDQLLHSHGLRSENAFDGTHLVQDPIKQGDSFTYELTFPDAGVYWYHPHLREDYGQELGLYGNFWVVPNNENYWNDVDREELLVLDDVLLDDEGIAPFRTDLATHTLMGRFGNTYLVNGLEDYQLKATRGETLRLFLTNVANTRTFRFKIENTPMKLVGADLSKYEKETLVDYIDIAPSERVVVEVRFSNEGNFKLLNDTPVGKSTLGVAMVFSRDLDGVADFDLLRENLDVSNEVSQALAKWNEVESKSLRLSLKMQGRMMMRDREHDEEMGSGMGNSMMMGDSSKDKIEWEDDMGEANTESTEDSVTWELIDQETNNKNMDISWKFNRGDLVKVKIFNDPDSMHPMQHPIHLHGQRFLVVTQDGKKIDNLAWKDTYQVPTGSTVELLVEMSNPGDWMLHCHISEHLSGGMAMAFQVG